MSIKSRFSLTLVHAKRNRFKVATVEHTVNHNEKHQHSSSKHNNSVEQRPHRPKQNSVPNNYWIVRYTTRSKEICKVSIRHNQSRIQANKQDKIY